MSYSTTAALREYVLASYKIPGGVGSCVTPRSISNAIAPWTNHPLTQEMEERERELAERVGNQRHRQSYFRPIRPASNTTPAPEAASSQPSTSTSATTTAASAAATSASSDATNTLPIMASAGYASSLVPPSQAQIPRFEECKACGTPMLNKLPPTGPNGKKRYNKVYKVFYDSRFPNPFCKLFLYTGVEDSPPFSGKYYFVSSPECEDMIYHEHAGPYPDELARIGYLRHELLATVAAEDAWKLADMCRRVIPYRNPYNIGVTAEKGFEPLFESSDWVDDVITRAVNAGFIELCTPPKGISA